MTDESTIETALAELLTTTVEAKDFILAELPEVIQQLLMWKMVEATVFLTVTLIVLFAYASYARYVTKNNLLEYHFEGLIASGLTGIFVFLGFLKSLLIILQIWVAPKVYLIEYVRGML